MPPSTTIAQERLYWNADKTKLVPAGHKDAATLYAAPGHKIPASMVERFGLKDGRLPGGKAKAAKEDGDDKKSGGAGTGNKQGGKGDDKSGRKGGSKGSGLKIEKAEEA